MTTARVEIDKEIPLQEKMERARALPDALKQHIHSHETTVLATLTTLQRLLFLGGYFSIASRRAVSSN